MFPQTRSSKGRMEGDFRSLLLTLCVKTSGTWSGNGHRADHSERSGRHLSRPARRQFESDKVERMLLLPGLGPTCSNPATATVSFLVNFLTSIRLDEKGSVYSTKLERACP
jgi:hypothetical protein